MPYSTETTLVIAAMVLLQSFTHPKLTGMTTSSK